MSAPGTRRRRHGAANMTACTCDDLFMRALLLAFTSGLAALLLATACSSPAPPAPKLGPLGGGVATVRTDLAGTGNPWVTLPDHEIEQRGRLVCDSLGTFGTKFIQGVADSNETISPGPNENVPDLNRDQTLAMAKASVRAFCPERIDMITW